MVFQGNSMNLNNNKKSDERILVIGADGVIGNALSQSLKRSGKNVLETSRRKEALSNERIFLDFEENISLSGIPDKVSVAFFCVAFNSLEYCRREPAKTALVNVDNTVKLAKELVKAGTFVVFLSTNLVYDGSVPFTKADTPVSPQTEHGRQKAEAERQLLVLGNLTSVIRLTKIFGPDMRLIQEWILALQNNKVIHPFSDKVVSPLPLSFAIEVFCRMAEKKLSGIVQVSGDRDVTYAQLAYRVAERMGVNRNLIRPISARESGLELEHLPQNTTLDATRLVEELKMKVPAVLPNIDLMIDQNIATIESRLEKPAIINR
jgi:dTDP-4-dehydrorhamnose reductase